MIAGRPAVTGVHLASGHGGLPGRLLAGKNVVHERPPAAPRRCRRQGGDPPSDRALSYAELSGAVAAVAATVAGLARGRVRRVAPRDVRRGDRRARGRRPVPPINPKAGERELGHIVSDSAPELVLTAAGAELPETLQGAAARRRRRRRPRRRAALPDEPDAEAPAVIVYTSGTTGPPKGAVLPRRAISSNLDALADAWEWTGDDVLAQALPLFHVHGLILGVLGPVRLGGTVHHLERFDSQAMAAELGGPATMMLASRRCTGSRADAERDPEIGRAVGRARVLVSGSAALPATEHARISSPASRSSSATA